MVAHSGSFLNSTTTRVSLAAHNSYGKYIAKMLAVGIGTKIKYLKIKAKI